MSNWNRNLSDVVLTSAEAASSVVTAERYKVKIGFPCDGDDDEFPAQRTEIFGDIESVTCVVSWDGHKRIPDTRFQQYVLSGKRILVVIEEKITDAIQPSKSLTVLTCWMSC